MCKKKKKKPFLGSKISYISGSRAAGRFDSRAEKNRQSVPENKQFKPK